MRKTFTATLLAALALSLTACGSGSPEDPNSIGTETNTYRGESLTCIKGGLAKTNVRTCDYNLFYANNPDLLTQSADDFDAEGVWWATYRGESLPCYKEGMSETNTLSCDYVWFYANHPDLTK